MNLPIEIIRCIWSHCDLPELKNFLLVSDEFRQMIIKTPSLMRKMPVIFYRDDWKDKIPFVEKYGKHVRSVKFDFCPMRNTNELRRILSMTPNVEELNVSIHQEMTEEEVVRADNNDNSNDIVLNLKALKVLSIYTDDKLTKALINDLRNSCNIETFGIEVFFCQPVSEVGDFLSKQNKLKEIWIKGNGSDSVGLRTVFTRKLVNNKSIKLKTLKNNASLLYNKELSDFLMAQSENIEVLDLMCFSIDFHYYRIVLQNFHNVKKICLCMNYIFNEARCAELAECSLPSVTEFECNEFGHEAWPVEAMIKFFPNLEVITMPVCDIPFHSILEKIPRLRKMKATHCKLDKFLFTKSLSMKELEMDGCEGMRLSFLYENLAENMPNIEKLKIKNLAVGRLQITTDSEVKIFLKNLKNFKQLTNVELENEEAHGLLVCDDHDNQIDQNLYPPAALMSFKFSLARKINGTFALSYSNYFNQRHMEMIDELKKDFDISEVVEEN